MGRPPRAVPRDERARSLPDVGDGCDRLIERQKAHPRLPAHGARDKMPPRSATSMRRWAIRFLSKAHLAAYRLSRGRVLGSVAGMPVLLLTTTGRRSGKTRTTPLTFFRDATDLVVIASNGGADRPPDWSLNLQQTPRAVVEIGSDRVAVTGQASVRAGTRAAMGRDHGHLRRLRLLPGADNATDPGRPSHTRRPAGCTVTVPLVRTAHTRGSRSKSRSSWPTMWEIG